MIQKIKKSCMLAVIGGSLLQFGGCGFFDLERLVRFGVMYGAAEFLLDSDAGPLDLFEGGDVPAA